MNKSPVNSSEEESNNKALNDVWLYDIITNTWKEIKPQVKVQSCFNSKKMRKSFEPRMAHSADVWGNYIIVFGGYSSQTSQYSPNNFCILSLSGCTDYMLQKALTIKTIREQQKKLKDNMKISIDNSNTVKIPVANNNYSSSSFPIPIPLKESKSSKTSNYNPVKLGSDSKSNKPTYHQKHQNS